MEDNALDLVFRDAKGSRWIPPTGITAITLRSVRGAYRGALRPQVGCFSHLTVGGVSSTERVLALPSRVITITETPRVPKKPICYDKVRHVAATHAHQSLLLSKMCHLGWDAHCIELSVRLWRFSNRPSWVKVADKRKSSQAYSRK